MKIQKDCVFLYLKNIQKKGYGYYGTDISNLAGELDVTWHGLQKRISFWKKKDPLFKNFVYLGRNRPLITLNEFTEIKSRICGNPLEIKQHILSDLQAKRMVGGKESIAKTTFYRAAEQVNLFQFSSDFTYSWFVSNKITIPKGYSFEEARESLSTIFTFSDMKNPWGPDILAIYEKLSKAKEWFSRYNVEAIDYYPKILAQGNHMRNLLTSIPPNQQKEVQARLVFEIQVVFIVECFDLLIDMLIHKYGRIQQAINKSRQKVENHILEITLLSIRKDLNDMCTKSSPDMKVIYNLANCAVSEKTKARIELLKKHSGDFHLILQVLDDLTDSMTDGVTFHNIDDHRLFLLAKDKNKWKYWSEKEKRSFIRDPNLVMAIDNGNEYVASIIAIGRSMNYIKQGKITFKSSHHYQNIGDKIKNAEIKEGDCFLTHKILEELVSGRFVTDIENRLVGFDKINKTYDIEPDEDDVPPKKWINFSDVLKRVSQYVRVMNPGWFEEHVSIFRKQTDGVFSIEYTEEEFADRLYVAIGFLGRNFRYRDSEEFWNLKYFIQRYLTEEQLILELKFIYKCMVYLTGKDASMVVIDSIGINSRKKNVLSNYHFRYHTIGLIDTRSVTPDMCPINSFRCRSTDSEAMNIISVMDKIQTVCNGNIKIDTGDAHIVSKVSAGMVFLSHGVVTAGRICHKPKENLREDKINALKENIFLLNKIGKLLRDKPSLGRVIATKKHIYVDGINIHELVEDLGYLILQNVCKVGIPVDDICLAVERSNYLKKKARIVEGGYTRSRMWDVELSLLSGELVIIIVGLYHMMNGWSGPVSPMNFSNVRTIIPA